MLLCLTLPGTLGGQTTPDPAVEPVKTSITVLEKIETEAPAMVTTMGTPQIRQQPGINLDDRLRAIPGFTLFRRSSSLVANPTTQGVSLRGLGSSGASRTLVLWDGVPVNDPFGGWVYWTRVAPEELSRIEVSRGASTSLFGDRAMSGVISLFSRPANRSVWGSWQSGNRDTHMLTGGASYLWSRWGASAQVRAFSTDGYHIVAENRRGRADTPANVRFVAGNTRLDWLRSADRLFVRFDMLGEERDNGTVLTRNNTLLGTIAGNYSREWSSDTVSVLAYHTREEYRATFSAVAADRNTERLTSLQTVPSHGTGGAAMWSHRGHGWNLLGGADTQYVSGTSTDRVFPTGMRIGGGSLTQQGTFAQSNFTKGPLMLFLGGRQQFAGSNGFFSPSAGFAAGRRSLKARGSVYRSFRAPTLNELYRPFRAGNAETLANSNLKPETVFGAEAGADWVGEHERVSVSFYRNELSDLITNVTLSVAPNLITRQRQNAASALTRGMDVVLRSTHGRWTGEASYLFADSRFADGARIPQVPRHTGSAQLTWFNGTTLLSGGMRAFGLQFEDDRNLFRLPGFATVQVSASHPLGKGFSAVLEVENLMDREFVVGFSPVPLIGAPRLWRAGLRWDSARLRP